MGVKKILIQFIKFGLIGLLNNAVYLGIYYSFINLKLFYIAANVIAYVISSIIGFFFNKVWVFRKKERPISSMVKFYIVYLSALGISSGGLYILVNRFGIPEAIAPLVMLCITIPYNFLLNRMWVFREKAV